MIRRERKLRQSPLSQRAYSLPLASRRDINRQIRLRVVREFNLPDSMAEELESAAYQFEDTEEVQQHAQLNSGLYSILSVSKSASFSQIWMILSPLTYLSVFRKNVFVILIFSC